MNNQKRKTLKLKMLGHQLPLPALTRVQCTPHLWCSCGVVVVYTTTTPQSQNILTTPQVHHINLHKFNYTTNTPQKLWRNSNYTTSTPQELHQTVPVWCSCGVHHKYTTKYSSCHGNMGMNLFCDITSCLTKSRRTFWRVTVVVIKFLKSCSRKHTFIGGIYYMNLIQ